MLALDDPRWAELTHAYGAASDIPPLLELLAQDLSPKSGADVDPWFSLWSALCHQGDTYTASYAAVPHLVAMTRTSASPVDFNLFLLPAQIEIARANARGPAVPGDIANAYRAAIADLAECVCLHRHHSWSQDALVSMLVALAVAKGDTKVAEAISNLDTYLIDKLIALDFD